MKGLTREEINIRKSEGKINIDSSVSTKNYKQIILSNIFTLFNIINLILGLLILLTGNIKNLTFLGVAFFNTIISMIQEIRSKRIVDKLSLLNSRKVCSIREDNEEYISIDEIVLDDLLKYKLGNQIVVDGTIIEGTIEVDESLLTGESDHILKKVGDKVLSGSIVVSGCAYVKTEAVSSDCYINKISKEAKYLKKVQSEIMTTLNRIIKIISIVIIPLGIIFYLRQVSVQTPNEAITSTVAALIGTIPEGLVLLTSTVLAIASIRLAKKNVLVQQLFCIENLARVDTICLDKTGTLTTGNMKVEEVVILNNSFDIDLIMKNINYNSIDSNSTSAALINYFSKDDTYNFVNRIPFSSDKKYSVYEFEDNTYIIGALEFVDYRGEIPNIDEYTNKYRVLLLGANKNKIVNNNVKGKFYPLALILINDEIRNNAIDTLNYINNQDVDIKIISGDNKNTVCMIANKVGITNIKAIDMSTNTMRIDDIVEEYNIFARVTPDEKKELVLALKRLGHKVAMTGDGVNDVLALKEADCSIAMASGSDAARNVSEIVLLDSDFKSIPDIIGEGRRSINNLERSASLFLTKTIYAFVLALLFLFINKDYPFIPIQLTLINAITIGIPSFVLALEPNYERVKGKFVNNIITKSLPTALTVVINIIFILILSKVFNIDSQYTSTMCVITVAIIGFVLLYKICTPFNYSRIILFGFLILLFGICVSTMHDLFELFLPDPLHILFLIILCFIYVIMHNLLTDFINKRINRVIK